MSELRHNSPQGNTRIAPILLLVVMSLILIIVSISINYINLFENVQSTIAYTLTYVPRTATSTSMPTATPTITTTPTLMLSTRSPNFVVGPWHDNSGECSNTEYFSQQVLINGVEIQGGIPPYTMTFIQYGKIKIIEKRVSPMNGRVEFLEPIAVDKGESFYVEIFYMDRNNKVVWNGELFYPIDFTNPKCPN